jgi:serine/threonine protein kinase
VGTVHSMNDQRPGGGQPRIDSRRDDSTIIPPGSARASTPADETLPIRPDRDQTSRNPSASDGSRPAVETEISGPAAWPEGETVVLRSPGAIRRPDRIGKYRILSEIGSGGMGTVYLAEQDQPRRPVALKVMRPGVTSASALRRFEIESQLLARLQHPAIAQVYESGTHAPDAGSPGGEAADAQSTPYFAMEYVRGARTLTAYANENMLDPRDRVGLFLQVCRGVAHGHERGVIHRDLKPANILVDESGQPKIIDFGVARCTDSDAAATTMLTEPGQIIGTIQYMSPEQLSGISSRLDGRTDIYSLGVVLFELMCRRLPYDVDRQALGEAVRVVQEQEPRRPSEIVAVHPDLETIILQCLRKDREKRFASVDELIAECERFVAGQPLLTSPPALSTIVTERVVSLAARKWELTAAAIVAISTILVGVVIHHLLYRFTTVHERVEHAMFSNFARTNPADPMGDVRTISVRLDADYDAVCKAENLPVPSPDDVASLRPLYGRLLQKFAAAEVRPMVVAFDIMFRKANPEHDPELIKGIRMLAGDGAPGSDGSAGRSGRRVDTVIALPRWSFDAQNSPIVAQSLIDAGALVGGITLDVGVEQNASYVHPTIHGYVDNEGADHIPGLAVRAWASAAHPGSVLEFDRLESGSTVRMTMRAQSSSGIPGRELGYRDVSMKEIIEQQVEDPDNGILDGATIALYSTIVPDDRYLAAADTTLPEALSMTREQISKEFGGKLVVIGRADNPDDTFEIAAGRLLPGAMIHAAGLAMMSQSLGISSGMIPQLWIGAAAGAVVGVLLGRGFYTQVLIRWAAVVSLSIIACIASLWALSSLGVFFSPMYMILGMLVAAETTAWLAGRKAALKELYPWRFG